MAAQTSLVVTVSLREGWLWLCMVFKHEQRPPRSKTSADPANFLDQENSDKYIGQNVSMSLYGLRRTSSDCGEMLKLVSVLAEKMASSDVTLTAGDQKIEAKEISSADQ